MVDAQPPVSSSTRYDCNLPLQLLLADCKKYLNLLASRLQDRKLAEEILQSVTLRVIERGLELRLETKAEAWLYRVLRNALADHYRQIANSAGTADSSKLEIAAAGPVPNLCPCVMNELSRLKPEYAEAIRTVELGGASVLNYAAAHGINANAASVRLHRARKSLHQRIVNTCGSCAGAGCFDCAC